MDVGQGRPARTAPELLCYAAEASGNPLFQSLGIDQNITATNPGGNMEGKETRFGIFNSALWGTLTTAT